MKKLLVIAVALTAINAQATRARVAALANSPHLIDVQTVYNNPADVHWLGGDYVNLETGTNSVSSTTTGSNPEGMVVRGMGDAKLGLSLGHRSPNASLSVLRGGLGIATIPATLKLDQQNPVELTYGVKNGDMGWGATLVYSNYNDKTAAAIKESSAGVRFGARAGNWDAAARIGLTNTVESAADGKFTGTTSVGINGGYTWDNIYFNGAYSMSGFKLENTAGAETAKVSTTSLRLGAMTSIKKDGNEFFYGASLEQTEAKNDTANVKVTSLGLPLMIGVETEAASWLTLRGSVTQTLQLVNNDKTEVGGTTTSETAPGANDTTVAAGAGLKFNKVVVDGTLSAATSQQLNSTNLLAQVGMTYMF